MRLDKPICDFGWPAPAFTLPDLDGNLLSLRDIQGAKAMLIAFLCNHCPYVKASIDRFVQDARELQKHGVGIAAIMPNDYQTYSQDAPENMKIFARQHQFSFPYLLDETQEIARKFDAQCTPEFFGFNADLELQYHGRLDEIRMQKIDNAPHELRDGMTQIAKTGKGPAQQFPSMGCSIKWRQTK